MNGFSRVFRIALFELSSAVRSRRAVVTALLFALIGAGVMFAVVSVFATLEEQVVSTLGLPESGAAGGVTMTLWRSSAFKAVMSRALGSSLLFRDMLQLHPVTVAFGFFVFTVVPLMTLITCAPVAAGEIRSGSVRYLLLRVSRTEWTLGLFFAEAFVLLVAMLLLAASASAVSFSRLPGGSALGFIPTLFGWSFRAWFYALAWLGICTGASLCVKSPGKATGLSLVIYAVFSQMGIFMDGSLAALDFIRPQGCQYLLWRMSFPALLQGVVGVLAVAFLYLGLGGAVFARRDV